MWLAGRRILYVYPCWKSSFQNVKLILLFFLTVLFRLLFIKKPKCPFSHFEGSHHHTHWVVSQILSELRLCNFIIGWLFSLSLWMWSYVILMAAKYRKAGIWLHVKIQNVTSDTCELLQSPNSGCGCSKAAASLQLKVGHKLEEKITSVACFMGWIVKYHLGSCQHMTKYRKTKWPVGREKHALKGKVRHDGLFFALCSASCSPKEAALFSTGRSLCFSFCAFLRW